MQWPWNHSAAGSLKAATGTKNDSRKAARIAAQNADVAFGLRCQFSADNSVAKHINDKQCECLTPEEKADLLLAVENKYLQGIPVDLAHEMQSHGSGLRPMRFKAAVHFLEKSRLYAWVHSQNDDRGLGPSLVAVNQQRCHVATSPACEGGTIPNRSTRASYSWLQRFRRRCWQKQGFISTRTLCLCQSSERRLSCVRPLRSPCAPG